MSDGGEVFSEAEGCFELQLYEEALKAVDSLSPSMQQLPRALRVRAACAFATRNFELAESLALKLPDPYEVFAARLLHELAAIRHLMGHTTRARQLIMHAIRVRADQRLAIMDDPALHGLS